MKRNRKPIVLTNAFRRPRGTRFVHGAKLCDKTEVYAARDDIVHAITQHLEAMPLLVPTATSLDDLSPVLDMVDGILLPGAVSNLHPKHYGEEALHDHPQLFAEDHDALDMFLVREALRRNLPVLGICRGMQAMNVALGGSLHQNLAGVQTLNHLCSVPSLGASTEADQVHGIQPVAGGKLAGLLPQGGVVNSLHEQAVKTLGKNVVVEARAPDGVVEAISIEGATNFALGVQWHPENQPHSEASARVFAAFKNALNV